MDWWPFKEAEGRAPRLGVCERERSVHTSRVPFCPHFISANTCRTCPTRQVDWCPEPRPDGRFLEGLAHSCRQPSPHLTSGSFPFYCCCRLHRQRALRRVVLGTASVMPLPASSHLLSDCFLPDPLPGRWRGQGKCRPFRSGRTWGLSWQPAHLSGKQGASDEPSPCEPHWAPPSPSSPGCCPLPQPPEAPGLLALLTAAEGLADLLFPCN